MRRLLRNRHPWLILLCAAGFSVCATAMPVTHVLVLSNCFVMFAAAGAAIRYLPLAVGALRRNESAAAQHVALGIVMASGFSSLWRLWSIAWLQGGRLDGMVTNDVVAAMQFGVGLGLVYHITVPRRDGRYPWWRVAFICGIVAASVGLSAIIILVGLDTTPLVTMILPYLPR